MAVLMLSAANIHMLIDFEKNARISEPDIFIHDFDAHKFEAETINAIENPLFASAKCMMYVDNDKVLARLDFVILPSFSFGGDLRAYVDWIYVLKEHRHKGIAQFLFNEMELYLANLGVTEYFLITAENEDAQSFYNSIQGAKITKQNVLTKTL